MRGFVSDRPLADPDTAARTIVGIANDVETTQNGRIYVERINAPHLVAAMAINKKFSTNIAASCIKRSSATTRL